jgi:hypothetical protein
MFRCIATTIYSHHSLYIRFKIFAQIRIQIFDLMQKYMLQRIFASEQIFASDVLILANICFKICVKKRIFEKLCANFTFKRIFAYKYSHTSEYSLEHIRTPANIVLCYIFYQNITPFTYKESALLRPYYSSQGSFPF